MSTDAARREAARLDAERRGGRAPAGGRSGVTLGHAAAEYLGTLRGRWRVEAGRFFSKHLSHWTSRSLASLSDSPEEVALWHRDVTKRCGPFAANHSARVLRAIYRRRQRLDRALPAMAPTSGVTMNPQPRADRAVPFDQFPEWARQVDSIAKSNPLRAAYHRLCFLTGTRPGELARLRAADVRLDAHEMTIGRTKTGLDLTIPTSPEIEALLRAALSLGSGSEWVFPAARGGGLPLDGDGDSSPRAESREHRPDGVRLAAVRHLLDGRAAPAAEHLQYPRYGWLRGVFVFSDLLRHVGVPALRPPGWRAGTLVDAPKTRTVERSIVLERLRVNGVCRGSGPPRHQVWCRLYNHCGGNMRPQGFTALTTIMCCLVVAGCAVQRAQVAQDAQGKMVGLTKEQVLACMGPPNAKAAEGATEVWSYASGDGRTTVIGTGTSNTNASVSGNRNYATSTASTVGTSVVTARQRYCTVNVTMADGRVARVNYVGPTGGLLTAGEQCAYAVQACAQ